MASSKWGEFRVARKFMFSAMTAYTMTKHQAFAFRAWSSWRIATGLQSEALAEYRTTFARLSEPERVADEAAALVVTQFQQYEEALFQMLDELAGKNVEPSKAAITTVARFNVGVFMGEEMRRLFKAGANQSALLEAIALRMDLTPANTRKLFDEFLELFPEEKGITTTSRLLMDGLRAKLKSGRAPKVSAKVESTERRRKPRAWTK